MVDGLSDTQLHQLNQRELFSSHRIEILQAAHIRGKCSVTMRDDIVEESLLSLLDKEDCFFYQFSYDPLKKTVQADKGCIRVGSDFQATIPDFIGKHIFVHTFGLISQICLFLLFKEVCVLVLVSCLQYSTLNVSSCRFLPR